MRLLTKLRISRPGRYCYTVPASTTGSLWAGYGGWHYRACVFALTEEGKPHQRHSIHTACRFILPSFIEQFHALTV